MHFGDFGLVGPPMADASAVQFTLAVEGKLRTERSEEARGSRSRPRWDRACEPGRARAGRARADGMRGESRPLPAAPSQTSSAMSRPRRRRPGDGAACRGLPRSGSSSTGPPRVGPRSACSGAPPTSTCHPTVRPCPTGCGWVACGPGCRELAVTWETGPDDAIGGMPRASVDGERIRVQLRRLLVRERAPEGKTWPR